MTTLLITEPTSTLDLGDGIPRRVLGGIELDLTRAPYATATIDIDPASFGTGVDYATDPRQGHRGTLAVDDGTTARTFDLALIGRTRNRAARTMQLTFASDEALAIEYTALERDASMLDATTLSGLAGAVLTKVFGSLTPVGADSATFIDVLSDADNLIPNPRVGASITGWNASGHANSTRRTTGGPTNAPTYMEFQAGAGGAAAANLFLDQNTISISPGRRYVLSVAVRAYGARQVDLDAMIFDNAGNVVAYTTPVRATPGGGWWRLSQVFYGVSGAAKLRPRVTLVGGLGGSEYYNVTAWRLAESTGDDIDDARYLDGAMTDTADYDYSFTGDAHLTISRRRVLAADYVTPAGLTWNPGQTAWAFLAPILTRYNRRLYCDENRNWRLVNPDDFDVPGTITLDGDNVKDGNEVTTLGGGDGYRSGVCLIYRWTTLDGAQHERIDAAGDPQHVLTLTINRAYPGPGAAAAMLARLTIRGETRTYDAATSYLATPGQLTEISMPDGDGSLYWTATAVAFDLEQLTMNVTTKAPI